LLSGCGLIKSDNHTTASSPYPGLTAAGTVLDVRGAAVDGATVTLSNRFNTRVATTASDGTFSVAFDGADESSLIDVAHTNFRPMSTSASITKTAPDMGTLYVMSKEEILYATAAPPVGGGPNGIYMVRSDGTGLMPIVAPGTDSLATPRRSASGMTIRWANLTQNAVYEAAWNGSGADSVYTVDAAYALQGISWSDRGTFVSRIKLSDSSSDIIIAEDPPGGNFGYSWTGSYPDASPPAFGEFGPQSINGTMLCFAGTVANYGGGNQPVSGLFTAFPYFADSYLVPVLVNGTTDSFAYPRWSDFRADASLDLAFQSAYKVYISHVTRGTSDNVYSTPAVIYGNGSNDVNVLRFAWSPEVAGSDDRLVFGVHFLSSGSELASPGDLVVVSYNSTTGAVGTPVVVYSASSVGDGMALDVDWR